MTLDLIPHPRARLALYGHDEAAANLSAAIAGERMHHAWLIAGPRGIGKATLAYAKARDMLAGEAVGSRNHPVFRQVAAGAHPDLRAIERTTDDKGNLAKEIKVEAIRRLSGLFATTAARGGWRVAIIDAADELNINAQNALLKQLEEPPKRSVFFLIAHAPGKLLPTIRSRCRTLALKPLDPAAFERGLSEFLPDLDGAARGDLYRLSSGSLGLALDLAAGGGAELYVELKNWLEGLPEADPTTAHQLADSFGGKKGRERFRMFQTIFRAVMLETIRAAAIGENGEGAPWAALAGVDRWLALWDKSARLFDRADAVNLEPSQVSLAIFEAVKATAK